MAGNYFPTAQMYLYDVMKKSSQRTCAIIIVLFCVTLLISGFVFLREKAGMKKLMNNGNKYRREDLQWRISSSEISKNFTVQTRF